MEIEYLCAPFKPTIFMMSILSIRKLGRWLTLVSIPVLATACHGDGKEARRVAEDFLQAYYIDMDFAKALRMSSDASHTAIHEQAKITALNPYAKEETPAIVFKELIINPENPHAATCSYTCNRVERTLPLRRFDKQWLVDLQGGTVETSGSGEFSNLSSNSEGGFASAASGEIKYKKRRQGRN